MILGIGTDIVAVERIKGLREKYGDRFLAKILSPQEMEHLKGANLDERIAGRFAAKEALVKALGKGGLVFNEVTILNDDEGRPFLGDMAPILAQIPASDSKKISLHISISHERDFATAFVVLEG